MDSDLSHDIREVTWGHRAFWMQLQIWIILWCFKISFIWIQFRHYFKKLFYWLRWDLWLAKLQEVRRLSRNEVNYYLEHLHPRLAGSNSQSRPTREHQITRTFLHQNCKERSMFDWNTSAVAVSPPWTKPETWQTSSHHFDPSDKGVEEEFRAWVLQFANNWRVGETSGPPFGMSVTIFDSIAIDVCTSE